LWYDTLDLTVLLISGECYTNTRCTFDNVCTASVGNICQTIQDTNPRHEGNTNILDLKLTSKFETHWGPTRIVKAHMLQTTPSSSTTIDVCRDILSTSWPQHTRTLPYATKLCLHSIAADDILCKILAKTNCPCSWPQLSVELQKKCQHNKCHSPRIESFTRFHWPHSQSRICLVGYVCRTTWAKCLGLWIRSDCSFQTFTSTRHKTQ
jgi:hypothetical protein